MRIVCLDYGTKRIGVAVSDELGLTAQPWTVLNRRSHAQDMEAISEVLRLTGASCVVVGLPRNMNGSYGDAAEKVRKFAQAIERATGVTTVLYDERMSTAIAERMLIGADVSRKRRRRSIDMLAAQVILQDYLDLRGKRCPGQECVDSSLTGGLES